MLICFVAMLECSTLVSCCIINAIMLLITYSCHSCFACHLQTVHPFPVILISISTKIISSFQRHTWFAKLMPCASFFRLEHAYALHITSRISCHVLHHVACALHRDLLCFHCLCSFFGKSRETSTCMRNLLSTLTRIKPSTTLRTLQARWPYLRYHFYLCLLVLALSLC